MRRSLWLVAGLLLLGLWLWSQQPRVPLPPAPTQTGTPPAAKRDAPPPRQPDITHGDAAWPAFLPPEAIATVRRIQRGGPFAHRQDGAVFGNRERRLPQQARGYYREYTVATPGASDRGARRIVTGGAPPVEYFYSDDHYRSFRRFSLPEVPR